MLGAAQNIYPEMFTFGKTLLLKADFAMQMSSIGGSSETEVKEFAVMPRGVPSDLAGGDDGNAGGKFPKGASQAAGSNYVTLFQDRGLRYCWLCWPSLGGDPSGGDLEAENRKGFDATVHGACWLIRVGHLRQHTSIWQHAGQPRCP